MLRDNPQTAQAIGEAIRHDADLAVIEADTEGDDDQALAKPADE